MKTPLESVTESGRALVRWVAQDAGTGKSHVKIRRAIMRRTPGITPRMAWFVISAMDYQRNGHHPHTYELAGTIGIKWSTGDTAKLMQLGYIAQDKKLIGERSPRVRIPAKKLPMVEFMAEELDALARKASKRNS